MIPRIGSPYLTHRQEHTPAGLANYRRAGRAEGPGGPRGRAGRHHGIGRADGGTGAGAGARRRGGGRGDRAGGGLQRGDRHGRPQRPAVKAADTTTSLPTSSTATPGAVSGAAAIGPVGDDEDGGDGDASALGSDGETAADEEAVGVTWSSSATEYRGQEGLLVAYDCPPGGVPGSVWGTDIYTDDSSVCSAAVHLGLITEATGGTVVIQISDGLDAYEGSTANGITSSSYPAWSGSFTFVG
jgi:hypothetical protein